MKKITQSILLTVAFMALGSLSAFAQPTAAAPTPTKPVANVLSMFSNAYTNVPVTTWKTDWSVATYASVQIAGNDTKLYTLLDYVGIETTGANLIDLTNYTHFHVDYWTPNMTTFRIKLVDFGANRAYAGGDDKEFEIATVNPPLSGWNSFDRPLSDFTGLTTKAAFAQLIFSGLPVAGGTLYIDNVYFYNNNTVIDTTLPVMGTASVVGSPAYNSVNLLLAATDDTTTPVISFIANDATNSITNKVIISDASGNATVTGLTASTSYNLVIKAKDAAGNISANSTTVSFTTPVEPALTTINFETVGQNWTWTVGENGSNLPPLEFVNNPSATGINTSTKVAKFTANATGQPWALVFSNSRPYTISANNKIIKVMVYKDRISDFALKLETSGGNLELKKANTLINQWEELTFDFISKVGSTANVIVIIPDFLARTVATINYFDNISFSDGTTSVRNTYTNKTILIYPSAVSDKLTVKSESEINEVIVRNLVGQTVKTVLVNAFEKTIDLSVVSSGNYMVSVKLTNGQVSTHKIVKL